MSLLGLGAAVFAWVMTVGLILLFMAGCHIDD
jgi:hypothetical protein